MKNSSWLKAGLLAGALSFVLNILSIIPCIGCLLLPVTCTAWFIIPLATGYLSAKWADLKRDEYTEAGKGGALAGLVLGVISGTSNVVLAMILSLLDSFLTLPDNLQASSTGYSSIASSLGISIPSYLGNVGTGIGQIAICGSLACLVLIFLNVILSALGGIIKVALIKK